MNPISIVLKKLVNFRWLLIILILEFTHAERDKMYCEEDYMWHMDCPIWPTSSFQLNYDWTNSFDVCEHDILSHCVTELFLQEPVPTTTVSHFVPTTSPLYLTSHHVNQTTISSTEKYFPTIESITSPANQAEASMCAEDRSRCDMSQEFLTSRTTIDFNATTNLYFKGNSENSTITTQATTTQTTSKKDTNHLEHFHQNGIMEVLDAFHHLEILNPSVQKFKPTSILSYNDKYSSNNVPFHYPVHPESSHKKALFHHNRIPHKKFGYVPLDERNFIRKPQYLRSQNPDQTIYVQNDHISSFPSRLIDPYEIPGLTENELVSKPRRHFPAKNWQRKWDYFRPAQQKSFKYFPGRRRI